MTFLRKMIAARRRQREAIAFAKSFHAESRARVADLAGSGRSSVALRESAASMGIDLTQAERPRLVTLKGVRL